VTTRRKKKIDHFVAKLTVEDEEGDLLRQRYRAISDSSVEVETQVGLSGHPLALAALLVIGAHAIGEGEQVPPELLSDMMVVAKQFEALAAVRAAAKNRRRHDPKDHGVSDDWPTDDHSDDLPF